MQLRNVEPRLKVTQELQSWLCTEASSTVGRSHDGPESKCKSNDFHSQYAYFTLTLNHLLFLQSFLFVCQLNHFGWCPASGIFDQVNLWMYKVFRALKQTPYWRRTATGQKVPGTSNQARRHKFSRVVESHSHNACQGSRCDWWEK